MMDNNPFNNLLLNIINYFVKSSIQGVFERSRNITTLVRIHSEKLLQMGDASFPCRSEIWHRYFQEFNKQLNKEAILLLNNNEEVVEEEKRKFLEVARGWSFPVSNIIVRHERCHLYLQRTNIITSLIPEVLQSSKYGQLQKSKHKNVYLNSLPANASYTENLSLYRSKLFYQVLQKLLDYSRWSRIEDRVGDLNDIPLIELSVRSVACNLPNIAQHSGVILKCGLVMDPSNNGKLCQLSVQDYLSIRSNDLTLMALHKYGIRVKQDATFCTLMERLGLAAVTVDLLEVKHTSPVQIIRNGQGSTRGASFILYNSARLETILRTFQERMDLGYYDPLPQMCNIKWDLLSEEEEWQLVYVYLAGFPDLIDRCLEQLERGICSTHLIIRFINGLVATFSAYYRRVRILTEKRDHLMPYVYARIYLIKAIREILNKTLALLDIEPVEFM